MVGSIPGMLRFLRITPSARLETATLQNRLALVGNQDRIGRANPLTWTSTDHALGSFLTLPNLTIQDRVLKVIATSKRLPLESVRGDSSFESLGIDSLDRLNILFDLESEFDIEINDEEAKDIKNIHEMVEGITHLVQAKTDSSPAE
jgi:acyl carrier protein